MRTRILSLFAIALFLPFAMASGPVGPSVSFNGGPSKPCEISGPASLEIGETGSFSTGCGSCSSEEKGSLFSCAETKTYTPQFEFDWGDGSDPVSGAASRSHAWTAPGSYQVRVRGVCDDGASEWSDPLVVQVEAVGICAVSEESLDFGSLCAGYPEELSFTVSWDENNTSSYSGNVAVTGEMFSVVSGGGEFTLTPGQTHEITIQFLPTTAGSHTGTVSTGTPCGEVTLVGNAEDCPTCQVDVPELSFGDVCLGMFKEMSFTISASPQSPENISAIVSTNSSNFQIVSGGGGHTLAPGESVEVTIRFAPEDMDSFSGTILTGTSCSNVSVSGAGVNNESCSAFSISPPNLNFTLRSYCVFPADDYQKNFTISCASGAIEPLSGRVESGCPQFQIVGGDQDYIIQPGSNQQFSVRFIPEAAGEVTCNISTGFDALVCTGIGEVGQAALDGWPDWDFGEICGGTNLDQTFTLSCLTDASGCGITGAIELSGPGSEFFSLTGDPDYELEQGEEQDFTLRYNGPMMEASHLCTITAGEVSQEVTASVRLGVGTLSTTTLDFNNLCLGTDPGLDSFTIFNVHDTCSISGTVEGNGNGFEVLNPGEVNLGPGESYSVEVQFTPVDQLQQTLVVETTWGDVTCTGKGIVGVGTLSTTTLEFTDLCLGGEPGLDSFVISNIHDTCSITGTVEGNGNGFEVLNPGEITLAPGETHTVEVQFTPVDQSEQTLVITTPWGNVTCTGNASEDAALVLDMANSDFGEICTFNEDGYLDRTATVSCPSYSPCPVSGTVYIFGGSGFSVVETPEYSLSPGESQDFTIRFNPDEVDSYNTSLRAGSDTIYESITLTGEGVLGASTLSTGTVNFPLTCTDGGNSEFSIFLNNNTECADNVTVSLAPSDHFSILSGGEPTIIPGGGSHEVVLEFHPQAPGNYYATVTTSRGQVSLSGTGSSNSDCDLNPTSASFSMYMGETREIELTIQNPNGPCPLEGTLASSWSDISFPYGGGAFAIEPGGTGHVASALYSPSYPGQYSGTLTTGVQECGTLNWTAYIASHDNYICLGFDPDTNTLEMDQMIGSSNLLSDPTSWTHNLEAYSYSMIFGIAPCATSWSYLVQNGQYYIMMRDAPRTVYEGAGLNTAISIWMPAGSMTPGIRVKMDVAGTPGTTVGLRIYQQYITFNRQVTVPLMDMDGDCREFDVTLPWPAPNSGDWFPGAPFFVRITTQNTTEPNHFVIFGSDNNYGYIAEIDLVD
jgi:hypothetical protein